jgi:photosystem II stability/assembly factor-like uncharacterized protein
MGEGARKSRFISTPTGHTIFVAPYGVDLFRNWLESSDRGLTWRKPVHKTATGQVLIPGRADHELLSMKPGGIVELSLDDGAKFDELSGGPGELDPTDGLQIPETKDLLVIGKKGQIWRNTAQSSLWVATRGLDHGHPALTVRDQILNAVTYDPIHHVVVAVGRNGLVSRSTDYGASWSDVKLPGDPVLSNLTAVFADERTGAIIIAGDRGTVIQSADGGQAWSIHSATRGYDLTAVSSSGDGRNVIAVGYHGTVSISNDGGSNWREGPRVTNKDLDDVTWVSGDVFVAVAEGGPILRTVDAGVNWAVLPNLSTNQDVGTLRSFKSGKLLIWLARPDIWVSNDGGSHWHSAAIADDHRLPDYWEDVREARWTGDLFAYDEHTGLYRSTNDGESWVRVWEQARRVRTISSFDINQSGHAIYVLADGTGSIYRSDDNGTNWSESGVNFHLKHEGVSFLVSDTTTTGVAVSWGEFTGSANPDTFWSDNGRPPWHAEPGGVSPRSNIKALDGAIFSLKDKEGVPAAVSYDGGRTWSLLSRRLPPGSDDHAPFSGAETKTPDGVPHVVLVGPEILFLSNAQTIPVVTNVRYSISATGKLDLRVAFNDPSNVCSNGSCLRVYGQSDADFMENERQRDLSDLSQPTVTWDAPRATWQGRFDVGHGLSAELGAPLHIVVVTAGSEFSNAYDFEIPFRVDPRLAYFTAAAAVIILAFILVYWLAPLWLLYIAQQFRVMENLGDAVPKLKPIVQLLLALGVFPWLATRPRVLQAWLRAHRSSFRAHLAQEALHPWMKSNQMEASDDVALSTQGGGYFPLPLSLEGVSIERPEPIDFVGCFRKGDGALFVIADGGSGKTSFALEFARWAMTGMLTGDILEPLWIDEDTKDPKGLLVERIREISREEGLPAFFSNALLQTGQLLVIVDRLSERDTQTQTAWVGRLSRSVGALLITSRKDFPGRRKGIRIDLAPLSADHILSLLEFQIALVDAKKELVKVTDRGELAKRLSDLIGAEKLGNSTSALTGSVITPLLTRLFVQSALNRLAGHAGERADAFSMLPRLIPQVYFDYLEGLNTRDLSATDFLSTEAMIRVCKLIAVLELGNDFSPKFSPVLAIRRTLKQDGLPSGSIEGEKDAISTLMTNGVLREESHLGITRIRYVLDPLAEYVAAASMAETCGSSLEAWKELFAKINAVDGDDPTGFRAALQITHQTYWTIYGWPEFSESDFLPPSPPDFIAAG